jgi:Ser/Thr protein kinase RdoA (MazF antagonist)
MTMSIDFQQIFDQFDVLGTLASTQPFGSGHINDTFLLTTQKPSDPDYIFQRINHKVFTNVEQLMENIAYVTKHIHKRLIALGDQQPERHCLTLIKTQDGENYLKDQQGHYWAAYYFIDGRSYDLVTSNQMAHEGGEIYGRFLDLLSDVNAHKLHHTIPNFHNIKLRLEQFHTALTNDSGRRKQHIMQDIDFVHEHQDSMQTILQLGEQGKIPLRVTHNDTKFNNILFDRDQKALCVIDLDTVMPGYIHYDYSDAIRTATNTAKEDERDLSKVDINLDLLKGFCRGFINAIKNDVTPTELDYLPASTALFPFMIGLRFLTDHLNGDTYFKTAYPEHNLVRARCQFQLVRQIHKKMPQIEAIIKNFTKCTSKV